MIPDDPPEEHELRSSQPAIILRFWKSMSQGTTSAVPITDVLFFPFS